MKLEVTKFFLCELEIVRIHLSGVQYREFTEASARLCFLFVVKNGPDHETFIIIFRTEGQDIIVKLGD